MEKNTFVYRGKTYQVIAQEDDHQPSSWYTEQIQYAIDKGDYNTVKYRLIRGLKWKWIKEL